MKKLLHLQLLPLLTGVQNFSLHLLDGLPEGEFEIWVGAQPGGDLEAAVRARGYHFLPLRFLRHPIGILDLAALLELFVRIRLGKFDIVHTNSSKPGLLGRLAASLSKVPLILHTVHGNSFRDDQPWFVRRLYQALEQLGNLFCHYVVFVNETDRTRCLELGLLKAEQALTVYNAIPEALSARLDEFAVLRMQRGSRASLVIGSTLRFSPQKNVVNVVSAACRACREDDKLRFILLGEGEQLALCRQIVRTHELNDRVLLPGWDPDVVAWLKEFDVFLLYSRWEAQPFSVIEAMSSGLPVIASEIPALAELVTDECGWLIPLDEHKKLIQTMLMVSRNPELARARGESARRRIDSLCSYSRMVAAYLALYRCEPISGE